MTYYLLVIVVTLSLLIIGRNPLRPSGALKVVVDFEVFCDDRVKDTNSIKDLSAIGSTLDDWYSVTWAHRELSK